MTRDQGDRERIVRELSTNFLVEAGAGSGKTTSMVARMVALIQAGVAEMGEIAAITFTRKAASELKGRFRSELERASRTASGEERRLLQQAMASADRCFIGTVHSFCSQLLRERPLEAGLDPDFEEMEEEVDQAFADRYWDEYLESMRLEGRDQELEELLALGLDVELLRLVYRRVMQYPDVEVATAQIPPPDFTPLRTTLLPLVDGALQFVPEKEPQGERDSLQKALLAARNLLLLDQGADKTETLLRLAKAFDRKLSVTQKQWTSGDLAKQWLQSFQEWQTVTLTPFLQQWREHLHGRLIPFVLPAVKGCAMRRFTQGSLNFQDLLLQSAQLLREWPEVRRTFAQRYRCLLVDEFQDTDPIQAEVMFLLTGQEGTEKDWRRLHPRPGSLFVVGDPKQSIYRFRRADIATYNFVKQRLAENGAVLQLSANFRSVGSIGQFVNTHFCNVFPQEETPQQAAFVEMETQQPIPEDASALHGVYCLPLAKVERHKKEEIIDEDTRRVASWIAWACQGNLQIQEQDPETKMYRLRPAHAGDFLILLKKKEYLERYAAELERYGIPAEATGSQVLHEEFVPLARLVRCLADPADAVALLAVLRSVLFGVSDQALYHYCMAGGRLFLWTTWDEELPETAQPVAEALARLQRYAQWVQTLPALTALQFILEDTGLFAYMAAQADGNRRSGSLAQFLNRLAEERVTHWADLADRLQRLEEKGGDESVSLFPGRRVARIMNLHKAKGLEASVVFLASPCGESAHEVTEHVERLSDTAKGYFTVTQQSGFKAALLAQPPDWVEMAEREKGFAAAEADRLLYVAATRAKQLLIVCQYQGRPSINPWSPFDAVLQEAPVLPVEKADWVARETLNLWLEPDEVVEMTRQRVEEAGLPTFMRRSVAQAAHVERGGVETELLSFDGERLMDGSDFLNQDVRDAGEESGTPQETRGVAFGTVVHRCLEELARGLAPHLLESMVTAVAREEALEETLWPGALAELQRILKSSLWERVGKARRRYVEVPFSVARQELTSLAGQPVAPVGEGERGQQTADFTFLESGVIDLVFEEEDGWVIVDWKTDTFEEQQLPRFVNNYRPQVGAYARTWQEVFGQSVKEAGIYFTRLGRYVVVR